jgi:hypothetical protein
MSLILLAATTHAETGILLLTHEVFVGSNIDDLRVES